jgi:V8-like Glu-specific endopeptidase
MPDEIVDPDGTRWENMGPANINPDAKITPPAVKKEAERDHVAELSVEELAHRMRPVMETGGYEYRMNWDDTLKLARQMKESLGKPVEADGEVPLGAATEDPTGELQGRVDGIFDGESRTIVTSSAYPWNNVAWISGPAGSCTAFKMINHYTGITAAHCFKNTSDQWMARGTIRFAAGTSGALTAVSANCYDRTVPSSFDGDEPDVDYGVIRFRSSTANCTLSTYNVGYFGYTSVDGCTTSISLNTAGYPGKNPQWGAAPPGSWTAPTMFTDYRGNAWTSCGTYPSALWFYNDFSPGMSGGPAWTYYSDTGQRRIRGIQTHYWDGVFDNSNRAVKIRSSVIDFMNSNAGY